VTPVRCLGDTSGVLDGELLEIARRATGRDDVAYAEPPVRFTGGFFTENHSFRLAGAVPAPWDGELVVRLFPSEAPATLAGREATVQRVLVDQSYPAPRIVFFEDGALLAGRHFFVMERLPGGPLLGGIRIRELMRSGWGLFNRMVDVTVTAQARLHRLDAQPLLQQLGDSPAGIERWLARLEELEAEFDGLARGREWLVQHEPPVVARPVICHGDLWAGNILVDGGQLTGVIDYTVATVAEPALEVGFTAMSLDLAPIDAPAPIQKVAARVARSLRRKYVDGYVRETGADLSNQPYYEALRCVSELTNVVTYRQAQVSGGHLDAPRPTWDSITDAMIDYFRKRTGVTPTLPSPARSSGRR
jgi:aminoglycoside phosphotransferase (APT) family kinase protein